MPSHGYLGDIIYSRISLEEWNRKSLNPFGGMGLDEVEGGTIFPLYDIPNLCEEWMLKEDHRDDETK